MEMFQKEAWAAEAEPKECFALSRESANPSAGVGAHQIDLLGAFIDEQPVVSEFGDGG